MPTYAFTTAKRLTAEQKRAIVESVKEIHAVEAAAPRCFVQVVFNLVEEGSIFIAGEPAHPDHVWVDGRIRAGRTKEQKAAILTRVMRETSESLVISEQQVWVYVSDVSAEGMLEYGNVLPEPGGEEAWMEALPEELRERLRAAA